MVIECSKQMQINWNNEKLDTLHKIQQNNEKKLTSDHDIAI